MKRLFPYAWLMVLYLMLLCGCVHPQLGFSDQGSNLWHHAGTNDAWTPPVLGNYQRSAVSVQQAESRKPIADSFVSRVLACPNDTAVEALAEVSKARRDWLAGHPVCAYCCGTNGVNGCVLNAHHKLPVMECLKLHDYQALTNATNFISLCRTGADDHLMIGHLGNFSKYNPNVEADCAEHRKKILATDEHGKTRIGVQP
jgi:hypothetical protein